MIIIIHFYFFFLCNNLFFSLIFLNSILCLLPVVIIIVVFRISFIFGSLTYFSIFQSSSPNSSPSYWHHSILLLLFVLLLLLSKILDHIYLKLREGRGKKRNGKYNKLINTIFFLTNKNRKLFILDNQSSSQSPLASTQIFLKYKREFRTCCR